MYTPELFAVTDPDEVDLALSQIRLGCLVTRDDDGFFGTHLPMVFDADRRVLSGHVALGNPHTARSGDAQGMAIFQQVDAYITPNWYPSKFKHGRVVPTWNYETAHVTGALTWITDTDWLRKHLTLLTDRFEQTQAKPWAVSDAPEDYIEKLLAGVVGVELAVREVRVKRKLSQNRPPADRLGVIAGLTASDTATDQATGTAMTRNQAVSS